MSIKIWSSDIKKIFLWDTSIKKVYLWNNLIFPSSNYIWFDHCYLLSNERNKLVLWNFLTWEKKVLQIAPIWRNVSEYYLWKNVIWSRSDSYVFVYSLISWRIIKEISWLRSPPFNNAFVDYSWDKLWISDYSRYIRYYDENWTLIDYMQTNNDVSILFDVSETHIAFWRIAYGSVYYTFIVDIRNKTESSVPWYQAIWWLVWDKFFWIHSNTHGLYWPTESWNAYFLLKSKWWREYWQDYAYIWKIISKIWNKLFATYTWWSSSDFFEIKIEWNDYTAIRKDINNIYRSNDYHKEYLGNNWYGYLPNWLGMLTRWWHIVWFSFEEWKADRSILNREWNAAVPYYYFWDNLYQ